MSNKILIATRNKGKVREYAELLADLDVDWLSLDDVGSKQEVAETGDTFSANAILKARSYAIETRFLTLADDSGLEVDALNGKPGIYSARFGGPNLSFAQRYQLLLENLKNVPTNQRIARFRCVIAIADWNGNIMGTADGICPGQIALEPQGDGGFGYDPVFYLPQLGLTMAQLSPQEKNKISHRALALKAIEPLLKKVVLAKSQEK